MPPQIGHSFVASHHLPRRQRQIQRQPLPLSSRFSTSSLLVCVACIAQRPPWRAVPFTDSLQVHLRGRSATHTTGRLWQPGCTRLVLRGRNTCDVKPWRSQGTPLTPSYYRYRRSADLPSSGSRQPCCYRTMPLEVQNLAATSYSSFHSWLLHHPQPQRNRISLAASYQLPRSTNCTVRNLVSKPR